MKPVTPGSYAGAIWRLFQIGRLRMDPVSVSETAVIHLEARKNTPQRTTQRLLLWTKDSTALCIAGF